jgi:hypothetical protein
MAWKDSFGPKKGNSRLSKLVTGLQAESLTSRELGSGLSLPSRSQRVIEAAGPYSDEEEVLDLSEDEEDL